MASIRIPSAALDLLPFCHRSDDPLEESCFDTYAHMIVVAACLGYRIENGAPSRACQSFINSPSAIDLAIFRSQGLFSQLLILSMLCHQENETALNEANLVRVIESLAERGLEEMASAISSNGQALLPETLAEWMISPPDFKI